MNQQTDLAILLAKMKETEAQNELLQAKLKVVEDCLAVFKKAEEEKKAAELAKKTRIAEELALSDPQIPRETVALIVLN